LDEVKEFVNFRIPHALVEGKLDPGFQPELGFSVGGGDMNMNPRFFSGEEEKPVLMVTKNRRTHYRRIAESGRAGKVRAEPFR
jgi:hypothetical protein